MIINVRVSIKKLLKEKYNIAPEVTDQLFNSGMLSHTACRDMLIQQEYKQKARPKERQLVKYQIADRYCLSVSSVEQIIRK